jgi:hypothetical protein
MTARLKTRPASKARPGKIRPGKFRPSKIGPSKIRLGKIRLGKIHLGKIHLGKNRPAPRHRDVLFSANCRHSPLSIE